MATNDGFAAEGVDEGLFDDSATRGSLVFEMNEAVLGIPPLPE